MFIINDDIVQPVGKGGMIFLSTDTNSGNGERPGPEPDIFFNVRTGFASVFDSLTVLKTE